MPRLPLLTSEQKKFISEIKLGAAEDGRKLSAAEVINEVKIHFENATVSPTAIVKYNSEVNKDLNELQDKPWNTAALNDASLSPDSIRWLMLIQLLRKYFFSKPITIREAKWFDRFSGFKNMNQNYSGTEKEMIFSLSLMTWAQKYAYREKIDILAGVKQPDYSDLDISMITGDFQSTSDQSRKLMSDAVDTILIDKNSARNILIKALRNAYNRYIKPSMFDSLRNTEVSFLGHSLGDPDMSENALLLYAASLVTLDKDEQLSTKLKEMKYSPKLELIRLVRDWCMKNAVLGSSLDTIDFNDPLNHDLKNNFYSMILSSIEDVKKGSAK